MTEIETYDNIYCGLKFKIDSTDNIYKFDYLDNSYLGSFLHVFVKNKGSNMVVINETNVNDIGMIINHTTESIVYAEKKDIMAEINSDCIVFINNNLLRKRKLNQLKNG